MTKRLRVLIHGVGHAIRFLLLGVLMAGGVFHFVVRDCIVILAPVFYALPVAVLWVAAVSYWVVSFRRRFHRLVSTAMVMGFGYSYFLAPSGFTDLRPEKPSLVFWNMDWGQIEVAEFIEFVNETDAEIYAFVEFHEKLQEAAQQGTIAAETKGYKVRLVGRGIALIYQDHLDFQPETVRETREYRFYRARVGSRSICIADISSNPRYERGPTMKALLEFAEGCDLICGDFNTPYGSAHLDAFRERFQSGRTEKFQGRETWPAPWPVLSLDHIFVSPDYSMVSYGALKDWSTDHYPVAVKIGGGDGSESR